jgi:hypothetical protein
MPESKKCSRCNCLKTIDDFYNKEKLIKTCKKCILSKRAERAVKTEILKEVNRAEGAGKETVTNQNKMLERAEGAGKETVTDTFDFDSYLIDERYDERSISTQCKILASYITQLSDEETDRKKRKQDLIKAKKMLHILVQPLLTI